uniref:Uncharacterized protein n=1 Tax=Desertifilum tharense IPPAS B-1220 TaxID=1781255 RepID=A0ACD5H1E3_9CYAN
MFPRSLFTPVTLCAGLLLPIFAIARKRIPLMSQLSGEIQILPQILLSSVILFFAAHALLFQLHLPSRYTGATFRIAIAIATGISLSIILDRLWWRMASQTTARRLLAGAGIGAIAISLMVPILYSSTAILKPPIASVWFPNCINSCSSSREILPSPPSAKKPITSPPLASGHFRGARIRHPLSNGLLWGV